jgi:hypothetical protein
MIYYEALHEFVIPTYPHNNSDDLDLSEMSSVSLEAGDIFAMLLDPNDDDFMMLCWVEHEGNREIHNISSSMSLEFLRLNSKTFNEITQQIYRDNKINKIVSA